MSVETFSLADGKYVVERDETRMITSMMRNGEHWQSGLDQFEFSGIFHAALNEIARLREQLQTD